MKNLLKKIISIVFVLSVFILSNEQGIVVHAEESAIRISEKNLWNRDETIYVTDGSLQFSVYLSPNREKAWIFRIRKLKEEKVTRLVIPDKIENAVVVRLGGDPLQDENYSGETEEGYSIFGGYFWIYDNPFWSRCEIGKDITELVLPDTIQEIETGCFAGMNYLKSLSLPRDLKRCEVGAFEGCSLLETLTIHDGIDYWNLKLMFSKCSSLKKIVLRGDSKRYSIKDNLFILSKDQKTLLLACNSNALSICKIPKTVTSIAQGAFGFASFSWLAVAKGNKVFASTKDGCVYEKKTGKLVAIEGVDQGYYVPKQIKVIDKFFIYGDCNAKTNWYFKGKNPPKLKKGADTFIYINKFYVPKKFIKQYKKWAKKNKIPKKAIVSVKTKK